MKYLGLDYGAKKIGLAIGDWETKIASPFLIIKNDKDFLTNIRQICAGEKIDKIIVGIPEGLQGIKSKQYDLVKKFIEYLRDNLDREIIEYDENLTSSYAKKLLQGTKFKGQDDDVAAMLILQSYLDSLS